MRVIILEDEAQFAEQAISVVETLGGEATWMTDADATLEEILEARPRYQALILDRVLDDKPDSDTLWMIRELRRNGEKLPVIITSALTEQGDQWDGLDAGAVDYITKMYSNEDLAIRLRRAVDMFHYQRGQLEVDLNKREAHWNSNPMQMPPKCFDILALLAERPGEVIPIQAIHSVGWPQQLSVGRDRVDSAMTRLRNELGRHGAKDVICNVSNVGYFLDPDRL
ncbi:MAG: response regulator transcription factor [Pseudomonadota bacterium]